MAKTPGLDSTSFGGRVWRSARNDFPSGKWVPWGRTGHGIPPVRGPGHRNKDHAQTGAVKMPPFLQVVLDKQRVGILRRISTHEMGFCYDPAWLTFAHALPLSYSMPLREEEYKGNEVPHYFDNLLPENLAARQRLARNSRADSAGIFDLLRALGRDCVGAFLFLPENAPPPPPLTARGIPVDETAIAQIIQELQPFPLGIHDNGDFRLSLAGVQDKTALLKMGSHWYRPTGSTPTTHLFKPPIGVRAGGMDFSLSVENEWFCLHVLERMGLRVAPSTIQKFKGVKALVVERFDRFWKGKVLHRKPVEDLCQVFGLPPEKKYEADGGPGLVSILRLLDESNERERDRQDFFFAQILFWLLGAVDGHAKNFSLIWTPSGFELAPLYDVLSAEPLAATGQILRKTMKLSMAVGDHRHYRMDEINGRHWRESGKAAGFSMSLIENLLEKIKKEIPKALEDVVQTRTANIPTSIYEPITDATIARLRKLF